MINAIMVQRALGDTRGKFLCTIVIKQADLFEYLTVKMLAFLMLMGKLISGAVILKH